MSAALSSVSAPYSPAESRRRSYLPAAIGCGGLLHLAGGGYLAAMHQGDTAGAPLQASAAVALLLAAGWQLGIARVAWSQAVTSREPRRPRWRLFGRWLVAGAIVCYLAIGTTRPLGHLFFAALALWYSLCLSCLILGPRWRRGIESWRDSRMLIRAGWSIYAILVLPAATEIAVRCYSVCVGETGAPGEPCIVEYYGCAPGMSVARRLPVEEVFGPNVSPLAASPAVFRVVAIGGDRAMAAGAESNFLTQLRQCHPQLDVLHCVVPDGGPHDYASRITAPLLEWKPDLVVMDFSVGQDLTRAAPRANPFDARLLYLARWARGWRGGESSVPVRAEQHRRAASDQQQYLKQRTGAVTICRSPMTDRMRRRWREVLADLDRFVDRCKSFGVPVALVVTPGDFQVNRQLAHVLRRRAGIRPADIDLDLPQRKLIAYGRTRDVPVLDLLPHLRCAGANPFQRHAGTLSAHGQSLAAQTVGSWISRRYDGAAATATEMQLAQLPAHSLAK